MMFLRAIPANLADRSDGSSCHKGDPDVSARWYGDRLFTTNPISSGEERIARDCRTPIAQPLSESRLSSTKGPIDPDYHCQTASNRKARKSAGRLRVLARSEWLRSASQDR